MNPLFEDFAPFLLTKGRPAKHHTVQNEELWIKVDERRALVRGEKAEIPEPVVIADGRAFLPITLFTSYTGAVAKGGKTGVRVTFSDRSGLVPSADLYALGEDLYVSLTAVTRVFRLKRYYNPAIGLLIFSDGGLVYKNNDYTSLKGQVTDLCRLLYDVPDGEKMYADMIKKHGEGAHPRMENVTMADFDRFYKVYRKESADTEEEKLIKRAISDILDETMREYKKYFDENRTDLAVFRSEEAKELLRQQYYIYDENGNRLVGVKEYTYQKEDGTKVTLKCPGSGYGDGYDYGGRSCQETCYCTDVFSLAYVLTRQPRFFDAYRKMAIAAANCEHWGEGHFLDCAFCMQCFARGLDRMWHFLDDAPDFRSSMMHTLYEKGLHPATHCIRGEGNRIHQSTINYNSWKGIHQRGNNWNTVCTAGVLTAAVMLMDDETYREEAEWTAAQMVGGIYRCVYQYAPDGAFIESPSYWSYGTGAFMSVLRLMDSTMGNTYGFEKTVGLRDSFRFAINICDPKGYIWGYHDGDSDYPMGTHLFPFAAKLWNDPTIARSHKTRLDAGAKMGWDDLIYYKPELAENGEENPLDYRSVGIETVTFRDGWDPKKYIFTGLHVGANWSLHGDSDCGNFILHMDGTTFFDDPGTENYNVGDYWADDPRYRYYNKSLESHNTVLVRSEELPHGQVFNKQDAPYAKIVRYLSAPDRAFATADMTVQYGSTCKSASRSLALCDGRRTVVLQDEFDFSSPTSVTWVATPAPAENRYFPRYKTVKNCDDPLAPAPDIVFTPDRRRFFLTRTDADGKKHTLRGTIVSDNNSLHFDVIPAETRLFADTISRTTSGNKLVSDIPERICIRADGAEKLAFAVVFDTEGADAPVAYTLTPASEW